MIRRICGYLLLTAMCSDVSGQSPPELLVARKAPNAVVRSDGIVYLFELGNSSVPDQEILEIYDLTAGSVRVADKPPLSPLGTPYYAAPISRNRLLLCKEENCQFYDPAADRWEARKISGARAPLVTLTDGRILRAGGWFNAFFNSKESYVIDPETLATEATGSMKTARLSDATVRLSDGKVLVAGGGVRTLGPPPYYNLSSAEIYDPATGVWKEVSKMGGGLFGFVQSIAIPNAKALVYDSIDVQLYDARSDQWTSVPTLSMTRCAGVTLLPNGTVLVSGGLGADRKPQARTIVYDPETGVVQPGNPMSIPRSCHAVVTLPDKTVLALGGTTTGDVATRSVEILAAGEPRLKTSLDAGYYIVTATPTPGGRDGFWGVEVHSSGALSGGLNFGGLLGARGTEVGFGAFYLAEAQRATATVNLQPLPESSGPLEVILRVLDVNRNPVAGPVSGVGRLTWSGDLPPGYYIVELRSSERAPRAAFQLALSAPRFEAGGSAGARLENTSGVPGFVGFNLASRQDVTISLSDERTYGRPRGVRDATLTLLDAQGRVMKRVEPARFGEGHPESK